ncbi:MAG TPA: flagellar basal-body rod protein FlgF [Desulfonauticus sp.]|jgi:flagellar basal-body rod protein FlgG|nr:flagellar basal-body rod protein FlgF [Desulfonauticus sp.]
MQKGMYSALFGALSQEFRLNIIANNLANVNTVGFKREKTAFADVFTRFASDYVDPNTSLKPVVPWPEANLVSETRLTGNYVDFNQGALKLTGNSLDVAIEGEGFFKVQTPGGIRYTRNGSFARDPVSGNLVTAQGYPVLGEGGPIELPETGQIVINEKGQISVDGDIIGNLAVVTVTDLRSLKKEGENLLYIEGNKAQEVPLENALVKQGYLEDSNVQVVEEMVSMIDTLRTFESLQKAMTISQEEDQKAIRDVGTTR